MKRNCRIKREVYNISGNLFLRNEIATVTPSENESSLCNGMEGEKIYLYELMDISTEIETGESYSMYVTSLEFFQKATPEEWKKVNDYLDNLCP